MPFFPCCGFDLGSTLSSSTTSPKLLLLCLKFANFLTASRKTGTSFKAHRMMRLLCQVHNQLEARQGNLPRDVRGLCHWHGQLANHCTVVHWYRMRGPPSLVSPLTCPPSDVEREGQCDGQYPHHLQPRRAVIESRECSNHLHCI